MNTRRLFTELSHGVHNYRAKLRVSSIHKHEFRKKYHYNLCVCVRVCASICVRVGASVYVYQGLCVYVYVRPRVHLRT